MAGHFGAVLVGAMRSAARAVMPQWLRRELYRSYEQISLLGTILWAIFARTIFWKRGSRYREGYRTDWALATAARNGSHGALRVLMVSGSFPPMPCGVG